VERFLSCQFSTANLRTSALRTRGASRMVAGAAHPHAGKGDYDSEKPTYS
jgi:hypothetical protein